MYCPICNFAISGKLLKTPTEHIYLFPLKIHLSYYSGLRFAPHLEKCLRGGKRGSKLSSSSSSSSYALSYANSLPYIPRNVSKPKKTFIDPYPDSLIIKIKLKNGGKFYYIQSHTHTHFLKLIIFTFIQYLMEIYFEREFQWNIF